MTSITTRKRVALLFVILTFILAGLIVRLGYLQFLKGGELRGKAIENRLRGVPVEAKRGSIYDRNGNVLVSSISVDSVYAHPPQVKKPEEAAQKIARILDMDEDEIYGLITKETAHVWIKRKVDYDLAQELKGLNLEGIYFVEESKRHYKQGSLASHVLGFTGLDNQGLIGLENIYDSELKGQQGRIVVEHDAQGRKIPEAMHNYYPPVQGNTLVLTLDQTIQYFVERELDKIVSMYQPKNAVIIVMSPKTGEILALGNRPTFDPTDKPYANAPKPVWEFNPAVWYCYEPGSTFKIITMSAALEEGTVKEDDTFNDPGYIRVADRNIKCWKAGGHGTQTFAEVAQNSCNPGFVEVGLELGAKRFYKYIRGFGLGKTTGIGLSGEASGIIIPEKEVTNLGIATMSIGQSIAVTPIQLLTAVSAVANKGVLMKPYLVKEIRDSEDNLVKEFGPESVRQVISEATADQVLRLLESVVVHGTGSNAYVEGYRTAGKTGTAQVVEGGRYVDGKYVASFAGFAPANDPEIAVLVMISEAVSPIYYGSQLAAPVFGDIVKDTLRYMKVPEQPNMERPVNPATPWMVEEEVEERPVPSVVNFPLEDAQSLLEREGFSHRVTGLGDIVRKQTPEGGATVKLGTTVILDLNDLGQTEEGEVTIPKVTGLTMKEAGILLENLGLQLDPLGTGVSYSQDPPEGSKVSKGAKIRVEFRPPGQGNNRNEAQVEP
ncbi:MAG TPA: stage V sporulation protein D [Clostridia bacterium]|nr:stage V sporulation protein D [Clostridia bacterium]